MLLQRKSMLIALLIWPLLTLAETPPSIPAPPSPAANAKTYAVTTHSGLQYTDLKVGTGPETDIGQHITVQYTGTFEDGRVFDSSRTSGTPFTFQMGAGEVIRGWEEGVRGMKTGGRRVLHVPPALGYGERGAGPIPANSWLVFDIELLDNR